VHYKGAAPAVLELISGRMDMMFAPMLVSMTHVKAGRLKALGVTSPQRVVIAPDLPTIAESGVPGYEARAWYGLVAPAKLDLAIVAKLNGEIDQALRTTEFRERLLAGGAVPMGGSPQEFGDFMRREVRKYAEVVRQAKISAD
jgi:tripartite-type tricarboxylate transporter receptor subunit TctC